MLNVKVKNYGTLAVIILNAITYVMHHYEMCCYNEYNCSECRYAECHRDEWPLNNY